MAIGLETESDQLIIYRVSSELSIADMQRIEEVVDQRLSTGSSRYNALILLEDFSGWTKESGWDNTSLADKTNKIIDRMAIVGPEKWRDQVEMFTLKGLRPVQIEYFTEERAARDWLAGDQARAKPRA